MGETRTDCRMSSLILRQAGGRIDYSVFNYCATCRFRLPKVILRCPECRQKVRIRPWHRPKIADTRRI